MRHNAAGRSLVVWDDDNCVGDCGYLSRGDNEQNRFGAAEAPPGHHRSRWAAANTARTQPCNELDAVPAEGSGGVGCELGLVGKPGLPRCVPVSARCCLVHCDGLLLAGMSLCCCRVLPNSLSFAASVLSETHVGVTSRLKPPCSTTCSLLSASAVLPA